MGAVLVGLGGACAVAVGLVGYGYVFLRLVRALRSVDDEGDGHGDGGTIVRGRD